MILYGILYGTVRFVEFEGLAGIARIVEFAASVVVFCFVLRNIEFWRIVEFGGT